EDLVARTVHPTRRYAGRGSLRLLHHAPADASPRVLTTANRDGGRGRAGTERAGTERADLGRDRGWSGRGPSPPAWGRGRSHWGPTGPQREPEPLGAIAATPPPSRAGGVDVEPTGLRVCDGTLLGLAESQGHAIALADLHVLVPVGVAEL